MIRPLLFCAGETVKYQNLTTSVLHSRQLAAGSDSTWSSCPKLAVRTVSAPTH